MPPRRARFRARLMDSSPDRMGAAVTRVASWFREQRFGMFIHMNIATVPAFSPVQEYADWYWAFWADPPLPDIALHPAVPLPEVLAWHRENAAEVTQFDDFIPRLTLEHFDADAIATLAADAGMRYIVPVTKHHDGFCWWDSAVSDRTSAKLGPKRDLIAELAEATRRAELTFGVYHSILDWAHTDFPDQQQFIDAYLHPQVLELVDRFQPAVLWGDGHWGRPGPYWRFSKLMDLARERLAGAGVELMVNDRWGLERPDFVTYEYDVPDNPPDGPWELCRGMSHSFCFNRAEEDDDHLTPAGVIDLLTEVVAKGGNFLLNIGPRADGTVPEIQADTLRRAGGWVNANSAAVHGTDRFDVWGDGPIRYTSTAATDSDLRRVNVIDLESQDTRSFPHFSLHRYPIDHVDGAEHWHQDDRGLHVSPERNAQSSLGTVYRVAIRERERVALAVAGETGPGSISIGTRRFASTGEALAAAQPGDVVVLGQGRFGPHNETFPLRVPPAVTLKGMPGTVIDGGGQAFGMPVVDLVGIDGALEGVEVMGVPEPYFVLAAPAVTISASSAAVRDCVVHGGIVAYGGVDHEIAWNTVRRGNIALMGCNRGAVTGNRQSGLRWGSGIEVNDGEGHRIDANELEGDLCAIRLRRTVAARVTGNRIESRWWGVHLEDAIDTDVSGNRVTRTMRAFNATGGQGNRLTANVAERCDSGVLLERGSAGTEVSGNRIDRCRVGVLRWGDQRTSLRTNSITDSRDHHLVEGS
jgi:alpha-L-fucosidase